MTEQTATQQLAPDFTEATQFAQQMVDAGVKPVTVTQADLDAMLAQMNALQAQVNAMNVERGVPIDRVDGYRKQLQAHLKGRSVGRPDVDFAAPETAIAALPENPDDITAAHTEALHFAMEQWLKQHPGKELDYLEILAAELHQTVLSREGKTGVMHQRVTDLETQVADLMAQTAAWKKSQEQAKTSG